jgi:aldehyde:ferredoxin oxidoreductase
VHGYVGQILRVNLSSGETHHEELREASARKLVGGTGMGAEFLYKEIPPGVNWSDPENRIIWATGPLNGTKAPGSGTITMLTKGPMTNLAGASQANGFLGAYLKFSSLDAIVVRGVSPTWVYMYIHDGTGELRDATHLLGKDTWETEEAIAEELELDPRKVSIHSIGPAGENMVRFACPVGDHGHAAAHNGMGAVMGSKRLKAVAVARGKNRVSVADAQTLSYAAEEMFQHASTEFSKGTFYKWGTGGLLGGIYKSGQLPVKNYTTNLFPEYDKIDGQYIRAHFEHKSKPCWSCRMNHVQYVKVMEGPYAGFEGEEPEYEQIAAWGPQIGNSDAGSIVMLANMVDRLGLDCNESGWLIGWLMECIEKGVLSKDRLDGVEITWGNVEAVRVILRKVASREGCGDWLAEGVMRASQQIGGDAPKMAIYTMKGASPRSHDHRGRWYEMLDTCLSNTGTIEASWGSPPELRGKPALTDPFSPDEVSTANAWTGGWRQFEDCLGICRFCSTNPYKTLECFNAVTGSDLSMDDALDVGRRAINILRLFNLRHGLDPALELPSPRYSSTPVDGPIQGVGIGEHFKHMREEYWRQIGWDTQSGRPLPETLKELDLEEFI